MKNRLRIPLAALCLTLVHCSMPSDVKETKDTSKNIEAYSKNLDTNSDKLASDSHYIANGTGKIFGGGRKDLSFERPDERYKELVAAKGDTEKIRYATALCQSFEFQQWTGSTDDTVKKKYQLYAKGLRDFFAMFDSLINHNYTVDTDFVGGIPKPPDDRWKTLASVAVAMAEIDPDQQAASDANHIEAESIYSLIVKGLGMKAAANAGKNIPDYAKQVLDWEDEAVFFLQLRHNYFPAMVMARFSDFATGLDKEAGAFLLGLKVNLPANATKIQDQGITWLMAAQETQRTISKLGYPLQFNRAILTTFSNTKFAIPDSVESSPELQSKIDQLNQHASDLQDTYKNGTLH